MFKQMSSFLKMYFLSTNVFSEKILLHNNVFLMLFKNLKNTVDKCKIFGAPLTDLSKVFDSHNHEFLIAKLNAYGFILPDLELIRN